MQNWYQQSLEKRSSVQNAYDSLVNNGWLQQKWTEAEHVGQLNARILENNSAVSWQCSIPVLDVLDSRKFCEINFSSDVNFGRLFLANGKSYPKLY